MTLNDLLSLAKDYRGELIVAKNPFGSDCIYPTLFRGSSFIKPVDILAKRLQYANRTNFEMENHLISNVTCDGLAILSDSHYCHGTGASTWSNLHYQFSDYTKYNFSCAILIRKGDGIWDEIESESAWFFAINPKKVAIHFKTLSTGDFELEILDPSWIAGYIS